MIIIAVGYENQFTCPVTTTPIRAFKKPSDYQDGRKVLKAFLLRMPIDANQIDELLVVLTPQEKDEFMETSTLIKYQRTEDHF